MFGGVRWYVSPHRSKRSSQAPPRATSIVPPVNFGRGCSEPVRSMPRAASRSLVGMEMWWTGRGARVLSDRRFEEAEQSLRRPRR